MIIAHETPRIAWCIPSTPRGCFACSQSKALGLVNLSMGPHSYRVPSSYFSNGSKIGTSASRVVPSLTERGFPTYHRTERHTLTVPIKPINALTWSWKPQYY